MARRSTKNHPPQGKRALSTLLKIVGVFVIIALVGAGGGAWYAKRSLDGIPTFTDFTAVPKPTVTPDSPVPDATPSTPAVTGGPETYLVFSTGATNITAEEAAELGIGDFEERGQDKLTDTLMLVVFNPSDQHLAVLSIPRDTWLKDQKSKINAVYPKKGPQALANAVSKLTGLPVDHMVNVDFAGFADLTDAVGGVKVNAPTPLRDTRSGLDIPQAGCVNLDGKSALSWVRSRHTEYLDTNGKWKTSPTASDFGRIERQQVFLRQVLKKLANPSLIRKAPELVDVAQDHLTIDEGITSGDMLNLARALSSFDPAKAEMTTLPSTVGKVGKASVVFVDTKAAEPVLQRFQGLMEGQDEPAPSAPPASAPAPGEPAPGAPTTPVAPAQGDLAPC